MGATAGCLFLVLICFQSCLTNGESEVYIIHTRAKPEASTNVRDWHMSLMASVLSQTESESAGPEDLENRFLHHYHTVMIGFAAVINEQQAEKFRDHPDVVGLYKSQLWQLHTTRTPEFLGLESNHGGRENEFAWPQANSKGYNIEDVIIGVLDSGIWPESQSFDDSGMKPVPARWKGACESGSNFSQATCNRKLIGARAFSRAYLAAGGSINETLEFNSPRDAGGHGTHTASTTAGRHVGGASMLGFAQGTSGGMAPGARLSIYKVCWSGGCMVADIAKAIDEAVADGVDILSMSLGGSMLSYQDLISIITFGAMQKGVFVSMSAGNSGSDASTVTNVYPWVMTVAASTIDRDFPASVNLAGAKNSRTLNGVSLYNNNGSHSSRSSTNYPLVYFGGNKNASLCFEGSLSRKQVAGKIVVCDRGLSARVEKGKVVKSAGGVGMVLANTVEDGESVVADPHLLPGLGVGSKVGALIKRYASTNRKPRASLAFKGTVIGVKPAPAMAGFSSRGPNGLTVEVLKPDVTAPGVNILAAWSEFASPTELSMDTRRVKFNIVSGTSMSCPHVSGVAALVKAKHPDWSPAAVKSALMTTAYVKNTDGGFITDASTGLPANPDVYGAGHISPLAAMDPGLVYDLKAQDYFDFLCYLKVPARMYSSKLKCSSSPKPASDLNYPAISVLLEASTPATTVRVRRTVTNVGPSNSSYSVVVPTFEHASIQVEPENLNFTRKNQQLSYVVRIRRRTSSDSKFPAEFDDLLLRDGRHNVRSPMAIRYS